MDTISPGLSTRAEIPAPTLPYLRALYHACVGADLDDRWHAIEIAREEPPASYFRQWLGYPVEVGFWIGQVTLIGPRRGSMQEQLVLHITPRRTDTGIVPEQDIEAHTTLRSLEGRHWPTIRLEIDGHIIPHRRVEWMAFDVADQGSPPAFDYWERVPGGYRLPYDPHVGDIVAKGLHHFARHPQVNISWYVVYAVEDHMYLACATSLVDARALQLRVREGQQ